MSCSSKSIMPFNFWALYDKLAVKSGTLIYHGALPAKVIKEVNDS